MPEFSKTSRDRLNTCDKRLIMIFEMVVQNFDCTVLQGHRDKALQDAAFAAKASKLRWPNSKHNRKPSAAIDVAPYPIEWKNNARFYYFAGHVMTTAKLMDVPLRWGGDWDRDTQTNDQTFFDLVHFEIDE